MSIEPPTFGSGNAEGFAHPEALSEPEKLLAAYFSASSVGLGILDSDLRFIAVNHKLAEINGIPAPEHLGKTVREVLGDFAAVLEPEFHRVLSTREAVNVEISATLPTRTEPSHWLMQNLPVRDATGVVTRVGAVVVDITAQKKLEQSLQDVDRKLRKEMNRLVAPARLAAPASRFLAVPLLLGACRMPKIAIHKNAIAGTLLIAHLR